MKCAVILIMQLCQVPIFEIEPYATFPAWLWPLFWCNTNTGWGLLTLNSKINVFCKSRLGSTTLPWRPLRGWSCHCWNRVMTSSYTLLMRFVNLATPTTICHHSHINIVKSSVFNSIVALNWRLGLFSSLWCRWDVWSCKVSSSRMHLWPCWLPQMWLWDSEAVLFAIVFSNG